MADETTTMNREDTVQDNLSTSETLPTPVSAPLKASADEYIPRDFFVVPVPRYLRHNPEDHLEFSLTMNILMAVASTFSMFRFLLLRPSADRVPLAVVANLYWCQPILSTSLARWEISLV